MQISLLTALKIVKMTLFSAASTEKSINDKISDSMMEMKFIRSGDYALFPP